MIKKFILCFSLVIAVAGLTPGYCQDDHLRKAVKFMRQGDFLRAEGQYLLAIEKNPHSAEAHGCLGEIYVLRKRFSLAIKYLEKALSLGYREPHIYISLAYSHTQNKDIDKAIEVYRAFVEADPGSPEAHLGLASLYDRKGMKVEADSEYAIFRALRKPNHPIAGR